MEVESGKEFEEQGLLQAYLQQIYTQKVKGDRKWPAAEQLGTGRQDTEKAEVINDFFALVFTGNICFQDSQTHVNIWNKEDYLKEDQIRKYLNKQVHWVWWDAHEAS